MRVYHHDVIVHIISSQELYIIKPKHFYTRALPLMIYTPIGVMIYQTTLLLRFGYKKARHLTEHFLELLTRLEPVTSSASRFYPSDRAALRFALSVTPKALLLPKISLISRGPHISHNVLGKDEIKKKAPS